MTSTAQPSTTDEAFLYVSAYYCWLVVLPSFRCCVCWQWLYSLVVFECMAVGSGCMQTVKPKHSRNGLSVCKWIVAGHPSVSLVAPCVSYGNARSKSASRELVMVRNSSLFFLCTTLFVYLFIFTTTTMKSDQNCFSSFRFLFSPKFWGLISTFHIWVAAQRNTNLLKVPTLGRFNWIKNVLQRRLLTFLVGIDCQPDVQPETIEAREMKSHVTQLWWRRWSSCLLEAAILFR
jgi:hypothetical protein